MNHLIQQQHLHVSLKGTEQEGMALQNWLSGFCNDWLQPAIEGVLDKYSPSDQHLYIEHLELDIGIISQDRLEQDLAGAIATAFDIAIREKGVTASRNNPIGIENEQLKTIAQTNWEAFIYFLETGRLPWSFRLKSGETLESVLQSHTPGEVDNNYLRTALSKANVRQRLVNQFSSYFLNRLLDNISPESKRKFELVLSKLKVEGNLKEEDFLFFEKKLRVVVFEKIAMHESFSENEIVLSLVKAINESGRLKKDHESDKIMAKVLNHLWPDVLVEVKNIQEKKDYPNGKKDPPVRKEYLFIPKNRDLKELIDESREELFPTNQIDLSHHTPTTEEMKGFYIDNAGLVLLHPFLPAFFKGLGIANDHELLQPERAICLLHFLTTGQECPAEHELILPKVLCNIPLETPVETNLPLNETEKVEAENLLNAAIRHWTVLGKTSSDGLREAFLNRSGKISRQNDGGWLLQVERNTIDILHDKLPWGISMIKLPWMEEMISVNWN